MAHSSLPLDTDPQTYAILVERWRTMDIPQRIALIGELCADVERLARVGIAIQHPSFTEIEVSHELARRRYGAELANAAYAGHVSRE